MDLTTSPSPSACSDDDLGLDPSDPLNLLLHNSSHRNDSSMDDGAHPPDWSQLSALWPAYDLSSPEKQPYADLMDYSNMGIDLDATIEPSALHHFDTDAFASSFASELLSSQQHFPFTFQPDPAPSRRLSITSVSSGTSTSSPAQPETLDPAAALAQRVRESAGVMLAVPSNTSQDSLSFPPNIPMPTLAQFLAANTHSFPDHPPSMNSSSSSSSSASSTPPPTTPPPISLSVSPTSPTSAPGGTMGFIGRPKTSHTTIERRYRTNLNARIQSLRMAVPALRVLEDREPGRKVKVKIPFGQIKSTPSGEDEIVDFVDDRGFVDGVKVARKCSKANVLGKAVEYIRVLKRREARLKREQDGLKTLLSGLVGGPALLREWERQWKASFGGEEKDEVEGESEDIYEGATDDSGDEDEEETGRKKKKPKVLKQETLPLPPKERKAAAPKPQPAPAVPGEKRKRGRPRKVVPPPPEPVPPPITALPMDQTMFTPETDQKPGAAQSQPQQYLLATFALFSFFNSPLTSSFSSSSSSGHTHTGRVVLPNNNNAGDANLNAWGWPEAIQTFHLLVSLLVFASILLPWIPLLHRRPSLSTAAFFSFKKKTAPAAGQRKSRSALLSAALAQDKRGAPGEAEALREALSEGTILATLRRAFTGKSGGGGGGGFEQKGLEQRAWVRLGEICVFGGSKESSWGRRVWTFWHMRGHLSWFTAHACDLSTLALVVFPLHRAKAEEAWASARGRKGVSGGVAHERLVLESMGVEEAARRLAEMRTTVGKSRSPVGAVAMVLVRERMRDHLETLFVRTVLPSDPEVVVGGGSVEEKDAREEGEKIRTVNAARSLGGKTAVLGEILDRVWGWEDLEGLEGLGLGLDFFSQDEGEEEGLEQDIRALLSALVLYRKVFPSSIGDSGVSILLSPPPSPNGSNKESTKLQYALRRALGCAVFDRDGELLEDARDRVVDMLVDQERRGLKAF